MIQDNDIKASLSADEIAEEKELAIDWGAIHTDMWSYLSLVESSYFDIYMSDPPHQQKGTLLATACCVFDLPVPCHFSCKPTSGKWEFYFFLLFVLLLLFLREKSKN